MGNVGKNVGSMKCRNLRVQTLVLPTMPTLPIGFRFVFDFYVFARTNRKVVGNVGNVGNSTHLHIGRHRNDDVSENVSAGTARPTGLRRTVIDMDASHTEPRVYSRAQAAAILGVAETTMARWATQGRGPAYSRSGNRRGRVWYTPDDVARWIESRKATTRSS